MIRGNHNDFANGLALQELRNRNDKKLTLSFELFAFSLLNDNAAVTPRYLTQKPFNKGVKRQQFTQPLLYVH